MVTSIFSKSKLFRCLVMFSILATILLLYNIVNISFARSKQNSGPLGFNLVPEKFHVNSRSKDEILNKNQNTILTADSHQDSSQNLQDDNEEISDFPMDEDPNKLVFDTLQDPDPGQEINADPGNKENFDEEPEPDADIPEENNFLPASSELGPDADADRNKLLKESFISSQKEAISKKFSTLNIGADTDDEPENILSSMQLSEGGKPIRNLIFATWGSGSSFVGDVVGSHPLTFYHFEPLMVKENVQIKPEEEDNAIDALSTVKALLNCDYSQVGNLINYFKDHSAVHEKNPGIWKFCEKSKDLCTDSEFLSEMCKLYPYQTVKLVRLRLKLAETLLAFDNPDVRVVHLVRDPRGIMCSRLIKSLCGEGPVCQDPALFCSDMVEDYHAAQEFREKYPDKFLALRYEDIALSPQHGFEVLLHHFRLQLHPEVQAFLDSHTIKSGVGIPGNSFLNTKTTPFQWMDFFKQGPEGLRDLAEIEKVCREAMDLWGYAPATSVDGTATTINKEFNPILVPPWSEMRLI